MNELEIAVVIVMTTLVAAASIAASIAFIDWLSGRSSSAADPVCRSKCYDIYTSAKWRDADADHSYYRCIERCQVPK